eukprot:294752_1
MQLMSTLSLAIRYIRLKFLHTENIWSNGNPMMTDPLIYGSLFSSDADGLIQAVWNNSTSFVYSAFDVALLRCVFYTVLLAIITFYATHNERGNVHLRAAPLNLLGKKSLNLQEIQVC